MIALVSLLTFASLLNQWTGHERVLDWVDELAVGLEAGEAALEAGLGRQGAREVAVHVGTDAACNTFN